MRQYLENGRRCVQSYYNDLEVAYGLSIGTKFDDLDDIELDGGRPPLFSNT